MSLNYLKDVLLEELDRKIRAKEVFENKLNNDYIYTQVKIKTVSGRKYIYVYSVKEKRDKYIGPYNCEIESSYKELIKKRDKLLNQLQSVSEDIPKLEKMVNII